MFSKFLDFVKEEKHYDFDSSEQFLKSMGGRSFLNRSSYQIMVVLIKFAII